MQSNRKNKLIILLEKHGSWLTGKELSQMLNVSDRTIRSDIESINRENDDTIIESDIRRGYRLNKEQYSSIKNNVVDDEQIPQTSRERCLYILQKLLVKRQEINVTDLLNEIYISEYSLDNHIKKIKDSLTKFDDLQIQKSKNHLRLIGSEESKRNLYKDLLLEETKKNSLNINEIAALYSNFDLLKAKVELEKLLNEYNYVVNDVSFPSLILHIGVSLERIINFNYVENSIRDNEQIRNSVEYTISTKFYEAMAKLYNTEIIESEIVLLALLLMGKKGTQITDKDIAPYVGGENCENIVKELLDYIFDQFGIDLRADQDLNVGLTLHLESLIERAVKNLKINNVYLQEIKRRYPLIFELALSSAGFLSGRLKIEIDEAEIGFISLHLGMAYERANAKQKVKAVIIFPTAKAISQVPLQKIQVTFEDHMDILASFPYFEEKQITALNPDLIICSVPLKHSLNIPTVQISVFMNRDDEARILSAINEIERRIMKEKYAHRLLSLIKPEHFFADVNLKNPQEIIRFLCDDLEKSDCIDDKFYDSVIEREKMSSTSFTYNYAIPHAITPSVKESNISIAILRKPVDWGPFQVKVIFLLAVDVNDNDVMQLFFEYLMNLSNDITKISTMLESKNYQEFINWFKD